MNQREAKREACFRAANCLRNAMDDGWPANAFPDDDNAGERVVAALTELIGELERRSGMKETA